MVARSSVGKHTMEIELQGIGHLVPKGELEAGDWINFWLNGTTSLALVIQMGDTKSVLVFDCRAGPDSAGNVPQTPTGFVTSPVRLSLNAVPEPISKLRPTKVVVQPDRPYVEQEPPLFFAPLSFNTTHGALMLGTADQVGVIIDVGVGMRAFVNLDSGKAGSLPEPSIVHPNWYLVLQSSDKRDTDVRIPVPYDF